MGTVHAAYDHETHDWVAIKLLNRLDAEGIYRIKREFRMLADVRHAHLVQLYELFEDEGRFFFTMELVDGERLIDDLHGPLVSDLLSDPSLLDPGTARSGRELPPSPLTDVARARAVFLQIASALQALHAAGKLHRDLKPDNVLIAAPERAVVLDFGIAAGFEPQGTLDTRDDLIIGTPAYMAPETLLAKHDARSDWYAFGAMLYEALVGELPIDDRSPLELLQRKQSEVPVSPSRRVTGVPSDLEALCMRLLACAPEDRPQADEVLECLARGGAERRLPALRQPRSAFVGRSAELALLDQALSDVRAGSSRIALVTGPSGMGKSALCRRFLRERAHDASTLALCGRCFEHESLPFNAFDGIVDALSRVLRALPERSAAALLPRHAGALLTVFPVLGRVPQLNRLRKRERVEPPADPLELRRLGFAALRELLDRVAETQPLIVYIDDLQWSDADSAALFAELIAGEQAPAVLYLCTVRDDEQERSPCLITLQASRAQHPERCLEIALGPLSNDECTALGQLLWDGLAPEQARALARDSQGSPFLLNELARHHPSPSSYPPGTSQGAQGPQGVPSGQAAPGEHGAATVDVTTALARRLRTLSPDARELLELLCVAGRPLPRQIYALVREHDVDLQRALAELRTVSLVRSSGNRRALCPAHDRIREAMIADMPLEKRALWHLRLARVLEAQRERDDDALAQHFDAAGDAAKCTRYAIRAAAHATRVFAFERAAELYALALRSSGDGAGEGARVLRERMAEVLVLAGRRAEAAQVLLDAAGGARDEGASRLRQRAGQELVLSGHVERGTELLREGLLALGCPLPQSIGDALQAWGSVHAQLRARGLGCELRATDAVSEAVALRLDTLWAVGFGLNRVEGLRSYPALAQHALEALEAGDAYRIVRGLCMYHAMADFPTSQLGGEALGALAAASAIAREVDDPRCDAWVLFGSAFEHWYLGEACAMELFTAAASTFSQRCVGTAPELGSCNHMVLGMLLSAGAWDRAIVACRRFAGEAAARSDRLYAHAFEQASMLEALMAGDLARAGADLAEQLARSAQRRKETLFPLHIARALLAIASGERAELESVLAWVRAFKRGPEARLPNFRAVMTLVEARVLAALACGAPDRSERLAEVAALLDDVAAIGHEALASLVALNRASLAFAQGDVATALQLLDTAVECALPYGELPRDLACYARARLRGGEAGELELAEATARLRERGALAPDLLVRALAPLFA